MPPPRVTGAWGDVIARPGILDEAVAAWLPARRWFAGKGRAVTSVTLDGVMPLRASAPEVAFAVADVALGDGGRHRYAVPLLHLAEGDAAGAIALLDDGCVVDAMAFADGAGAIVAAALERVHVAPGEHAIRLLGVEQSNSSVIVDERMIAKLVRRLEPGTNPDAEIPRHLADVGFAHAPALVATFDVALPGDDGTADVVIVHEAVANDGDLWKWMSEHLSTVTGDPADDGAALAIATLLGRRTAELHVALACVAAVEDAAGFAPEPFTIESQCALLEKARRSLVATQRALDGRDLAVEFEPLMAAPERILRRYEPFRHARLPASRIRIHGDLHLGQVLWTGDDVTFIDFEGEPDRPMAERTTKQSPLVDVAGLLRSIDYAGRSAAAGRAAGLDGWREAWTAAMSDALLSVYLDSIDAASAEGGRRGAPLVPADRAQSSLLLDLFLLEKALYEVRYELGHRPDWAAWPLAAVVDLVTR